MADVYLDTALADFSGYLAIDEAYDGPFCVLSVVDNRRHHRLAFQVLERDPTQDDIRVFLQGFKGQLARRGQSVRGITTDGSSLYPKVLQELWPDIPHQLCEFHVLKEITKAVLHAPATRPGRYTILERLDLDENQIAERVESFAATVGSAT